MRIMRNVIRMTTRITGIVHTMRLMMKASIVGTGIPGALLGASECS